MKKLLLTCAAALMAVGAWADDANWAMSNTSYSADQELSSDAAVVSVKLGKGTWAYNATWGVQGTPSNAAPTLTDGIPTEGNYLVIEPAESVTMTLSTRSSTNHNFVMIEASAPTTEIINVRGRYYLDYDLGTLEAGKTYYVFSKGGADLGYRSFSATKASKATYDYVVTNNFGDVIDSGSLYEDETKVVCWNKCIVHEGQMYETPAPYGVTITKDNKEQVVTYSSSSISYFFEAESILSRTYGNVNGIYSGGTTAGVYNGATLTTSQIASGVYTVTVNSSIRRANEDRFLVQVSYNGADWDDAGIITLASSVGGDYSLDNVVLSDNGQVRLVENVGQNMCHYIDYLTLTRTAAPVTISAAGWATFVPTCNVDFTGNANITAYNVTVNTIENVVYLKELGIVPANTAVVVSGTSGTVAVTSETASFDTELTFANTETESDGTQYVLTQQEGKIVFAPVAIGTMIPARKGFLNISNDAASYRIEIEGMEDGYQTAISLTPSLTEGEGACYDLYGRKSNGKGLMIQNGKVVLVK